MLTTINLKQKTEVVKPFFGFYFGLYFLEDVQQPLIFFMLFKIEGFAYFLTTGYDFMESQVASAA